jgi:hypothetical protein
MTVGRLDALEAEQQPQGLGAVAHAGFPAGRP